MHIKFIHNFTPEKILFTLTQSFGLKKTTKPKIFDYSYFFMCFILFVSFSLIFCGKMWDIPVKIKIQKIRHHLDDRKNQDLSHKK